MRCIILIDIMIQFFHGDDEYYDHLSKQISARLQSGVTDSSGVASTEYLFSRLDTLWGFFAPLATSYYLMARSGKPYTSIKTDAGYIIVFQKFGEILCIAVNGDGKETELEMLRKCYILHTLTRLFVGPLEDQLNPGDMGARTELWNKIGRCIDSWSYLYSNRPAILVEAIERLQVKEEISFKCREELMRCMSSLKVAEISPILHSLVFVDSKLFLHISHLDPPLVSQSFLILSMYVQANFTDINSAYPPETDINNPFYTKERLFLPTAAGTITPLTVYCVGFGVGMVLVLLVRCGDPILANNICTSISSIQTITTLSSLNRRPENSRDLIVLIDMYLKRSADTWNKISFANGADQFKSMCGSVIATWEKCKADGLAESIEMRRLEPSHENQINKVLRDLQKIFTILYYARVYRKQSDADGMMFCCKILNTKFATDYGDFLQVKAERNIHANIDVSNYHGLAYYLFVNRRNDSYTAVNFCERDSVVGVSCLDELTGKRGKKSGVLLRQKVWDLVDRVHRFSQHGCTLQIWEEEDFVLSYHLWFCNQRSGVRIACQERLFSEGIPPGILTDPSSYKRYGREVVVLELYMIHMRDTNLCGVIANAELISEKLWQQSRESAPRFAAIL
ncbi:hypothetical protein LOD99_342 [Oopsacas minuta]|uniref:FUZ/MON1/HPS1 first Longin domain-containing protein n=1 Tax=Oopsacas minuta TaxID=111878 RepID=A0AAV7K8R3_9METZ|nr:hypothetical protein LOD99_342 [Oopsacas minuta]